MSPRRFEDSDIATMLGEFTRELGGMGADGAVARLLARCGEADADSGARIVASLLQLQRVPLALELLERQVVRWPVSAELHALRGNALRLLGRATEAEAALRRALALDAMHSAASLSLAYLLREQGRLSAAADTMLVAWRAQPRTRAGDAAVLAFLRECQRGEPAEIVAAAAVAMWPDDAALLGAAGELAMDRGDFDAAHARLLAATQQDPARGASWLRLAHTRRYESADDAELESMRKARAQTRSAEAAICLDFALGKACDDLSDRAGAVRHWREGNARAAAAQRWNADGWRRFVEQQLRVPAIAPAPLADSLRPVFVIGLPRTGTTLLASLLDRHPQLRNRGELNWLAALAARLGPSPERAALAAAATLFAAQLRQDDAPALCYLDKNPLNFRHLGLALALFPQARVLHCRRSARDTALSIWSQHFAHSDLAWSYDFAGIAAFAQGERALMQHWQRGFPTSILALDYEDLVRDSDGVLARVQAFLELPSVSLQDAPTGSGGFRTASVWQARQAVNTRSVGRWRDYADALPELLQFSE